jgi:hypothetical protein
MAAIVAAIMEPLLVVVELALVITLSPYLDYEPV